MMKIDVIVYDAETGYEIERNEIKVSDFFSCLLAIHKTYTITNFKFLSDKRVVVWVV